MLCQCVSFNFQAQSNESVTGWFSMTAYGAVHRKFGWVWCSTSQNKHIARSVTGFRRPLRCLAASISCRKWRLFLKMQTPFPLEIRQEVDVTCDTISEAYFCEPSISNRNMYINDFNCDNVWYFLRCRWHEKCALITSPFWPSPLSIPYYKLPANKFVLFFTISKYLAIFEGVWLLS